MQAKEIMSRRVRSVPPTMTVRELAKLFTELRISGAPVVSEDGSLLGVVSQTDLVRYDREAPFEVEVAAGAPAEDIPRGYHVESPDYTPVSEIMTPGVISASETTPIEKLARMMLKAHVHRLVITKGEQITGIVTSLDLLRVLVGEPKKAGERKE